MSVKIIQKPISQTLRQLLEDGKLTEKQKNLWERYLDFLDAEQVKDLCEIIEKDSESFDGLMFELEANANLK